MAASVLDLHEKWNGDPPDGVEDVINTGIDNVEVTWHEGLGLWLGDSEPHCYIKGDWIHNGAGGVTPGGYRYLYEPIGNPGTLGNGSYGFSPVPVYEPSAKIDAGLKLFERALVMYWIYDPGNDTLIWFVKYPMNDGASISGTIVPQDYRSLSVKAREGQRVATDTGWVEDALDPGDGLKHWAFHLYSQYLDAPSQAYLESPILAEFYRRWAGDPYE